MAFLLGRGSFRTVLRVLFGTFRMFGVLGTLGVFAFSTFCMFGTVVVLLVEHLHFFPLVTLAGNACDKQAGSEQEGSFHLGRGCSASAPDGKR